MIGLVLTMTKDKDINVMIDIETLGKKAGCSILSIGATVFGTTDNIAREDFYVTVDRYSCGDLGLFEESDTVDWWRKQSPEARAEAFSGKLDIRTALGKLYNYIKDIEAAFNVSTKVWANGANFDIPILEAAYDLADISVPWRYHNVRCYRTLKALATVAETSFQGVKHNALADAMHQARNAVRFLASLEKENAQEKQNVPSLPT